MTDRAQRHFDLLLRCSRLESRLVMIAALHECLDGEHCDWCGLPSPCPERQVVSETLGESETALAVRTMRQRALKPVAGLGGGT